MKLAEITTTDGRRVVITADEEPSSYYAGQTSAWVIQADDQDAGIAPQQTLEDARQAVGMAWGQGAWELEFVEAAE